MRQENTPVTARSCAFGRRKGQGCRRQSAKLLEAVKAKNIKIVQKKKKKSMRMA